MGTKTGLNGITFGDATVQNTAAVTGVSSAVAGSGISVSGSTGAVTFTNSGVTSIVAGTGISVSGGTGAVTVTASGGGVTSAVAGNGITVSGATGAVTFSLDVYSGTSAQQTSYPVGSYFVGNSNAGLAPGNLNQSVPYVWTFNASYTLQQLNMATSSGSPGGYFVSVAGTWRSRGQCSATDSYWLIQRVS
jgi:hypothetical protein